MTSNLPPPPPFILPPPPMFPADSINSRVVHLTCATSGQQPHPSSLLFTTSIVFLIAALFVLIFICIRLLSDRKPSTNHLQRNPSICTNRSYQTVSSGLYLESVQTSAITPSPNPSNLMCNRYQRISSPPAYGFIQ